MHRFNGQGDKQWGINNAVRWHWPYFVPFNLRWYFDAQCPRHSLAHRRFSRSLFKGWKKRDTSCLTEITSLPKPPKDINENAGATYWVFFGDSVEIYIFIFPETMWMLSVCLTTGVDSWADALKVNCERFDRGLKRQCNNLFFTALWGWYYGAKKSLVVQVQVTCTNNNG